MILKIIVFAKSDFLLKNHVSFVCLLFLFQVGIYNSIKPNEKANLLAYTRSSLDHLLKKHNTN